MAFTIYFAFSDFPATVGTLLCFAEFLLRSFTAAKSVLNALASVRALHVEGGFDAAAFDQPALIKWKRALPFTLRTAPAPAPPLPVTLLVQFCKFAASLGSKGRVFATLLSVTFFSMARLSSLLPVSLSGFDRSRLPCLADVSFDQHGCSLLLKWAKNRQDAAQGFRVPLLPFATEAACPVRNLYWLVRALRLAPPSTPLFSFPVSSGRSHSGFTMQLARVWLKCFNEALAPNAQRYTFHSFRRGACTLAHERGASVSDLKSLGGWRSEAVNRYFSGDSARRRAASFLTSN